MQSKVGVVNNQKETIFFSLLQTMVSLHYMNLKAGDGMAVYL